MFSRTEILVCMLIIALVPLSCTRLDQVATIGTSSVAMEELPSDGSIPSQYGDLISVSSLDQYPTMVQLWFQKKRAILGWFNIPSDLIISLNSFMYP